MQGMISLADMLRVMATGVPFSGTFVTCNLDEETGGRKINVTNAVLAGGSFGKKVSSKNANHWINGTRNVMIPGRDRPITIHNLLWTRFNEERVIV